MATASLSIRRRARSGSGSSTGLRANWFGRLSRAASQSNRSRGIDEVPSDEALGKGQPLLAPGRLGRAPSRPITISVGLLENPPKDQQFHRVPRRHFHRPPISPAARKLRFPTPVTPVEQKPRRARDLFGLTLDRPSKVVIRSRVSGWDTPMIGLACRFGGIQSRSR